MNMNFLELGKQLANICKQFKGEPPDLLLSVEDKSQPVSSEHNQPYSTSVVDLDNPPYASAILQDYNYTPAKHIKVSMPRFDGIDVEHWLFAVWRYFIFNKVPDEQKLLIVSFHLNGIARKCFAWLEASNMLSIWKIFVEVVVKKFTNFHYCLPGGKLSKLCQEGNVTEY